MLWLALYSALTVRITRAYRRGEASAADQAAGVAAGAAARLRGRAPYPETRPRPGAGLLTGLQPHVFHGYVSLEMAGGFSHSTPDAQESWSRILDALDALLRNWARTLM